ncbi:MAG: DUF1761 domain-containing protein [Gammaproteobacteria bacterium]|nr:DUF1761 domain-containing protein [Gammaproteobacteria bacterium]
MWNIADLNWLAILVATVAGFAIGGVWYGPLFGKAWMDALGKKPEDLTPSAQPYIISFVTALITALVLALLINALGITGAVDGLLIGLAVGVGFIATAMASDSAFCGWSLNLFLIQAGYRVTYSMVMGVILAVWR